MYIALLRALLRIMPGAGGGDRRGHWHQPRCRLRHPMSWSLFDLLSIKLRRSHFYVTTCHHPFASSSPRMRISIDMYNTLRSAAKPIVLHKFAKNDEAWALPWVWVWASRRPSPEPSSRRVPLSCLDGEKLGRRGGKDVGGV